MTLVDCDITAPTGIDASGNANITVTGGSINGSQTAVKVTGKKEATGAAKIIGP